jgi:hypothetical protein
VLATENGTLAELAAKWGKTEAEETCHGCGASGPQDCTFLICTKAKGIESCAECSEMPCKHTNGFMTDDCEHHKVVITNLKRIKQIGISAWLQEQAEEWKCKKCGTRTEWYQTECTKCHATL